VEVRDEERVTNERLLLAWVTLIEAVTQSVLKLVSVNLSDSWATKLSANYQ
jgi:hypothetical protein